MSKGLSGRTLSPEKALSEVKATLKKDMEIDGAWIYLHPEEWENGKVYQNVYHGGVTENHNGETIHYDFVVDANTGTLIQLHQQE